MKVQLIAAFICTAALSMGCHNGEQQSDAYGTFESTETTISSEMQGKLLSFNVEEGEPLKKGEVVAQIDSVQTYLKVRQLEAQLQATNSQKNNILAQSNVYAQQLENVNKDYSRVKDLYAQNAATPKQMDDVDGQVKLVEAQKKAVDVQLQAIKDQATAIEMQILQVKDQLSRCRVVNPITGTVLVKLAEVGEVTAPGKNLYRIADMDELTLRVYISENQISAVHLGDTVVVITDVKNGLRENKGVVSWISSEAEFTPKIVQTREERVKLVYAVKVRVKNTGDFKIGMPGEIRFIKHS